MTRAVSRRALVLQGLFVPVLLAGCSAKRFQRQPPTTLAPDGGYAPAPVDSRVLMPGLTAVAGQRTPGGLIVTATAVAPQQGYYDAALVKAPTSDSPSSTLRLEFRVRTPAGPGDVGPEAARTVQVGLYLSDEVLSGIRRIDVVAAGTTRSISR